MPIYIIIMRNLSIAVKIALQDDDCCLPVDDFFSFVSAHIGFDQDTFRHDRRQTFIVEFDIYMIHAAAFELVFKLLLKLPDLLRLGAVCAVQFERQTDHYRVTVIFFDIIQDLAGILLDPDTLNGRNALSSDVPVRR